MYNTKDCITMMNHMFDGFLLVNSRGHEASIKNKIQPETLLQLPCCHRAAYTPLTQHKNHHLYFILISPRCPHTPISVQSHTAHTTHISALHSNYTIFFPKQQDNNPKPLSTPLICPLLWFSKHAAKE